MLHGGAAEVDPTDAPPLAELKELLAGGGMSVHLAIVPAYNEVGAIAETIAEIHAAAPDFDVIVVDDGSLDNTARSASAAGAKVIRCRSTSESAEPCSAGTCTPSSTATRWRQVDGDGQHDPREIPRLVAAMRAKPASTSSAAPDSSAGRGLSLAAQPPDRDRAVRGGV